MGIGKVGYLFTYLSRWKNSARIKKEEQTVIEQASEFSHTCEITAHFYRLITFKFKMKLVGASCLLSMRMIRRTGKPQPFQAFHNIFFYVLLKYILKFGS